RFKRAPELSEGRTRPNGLAWSNGRPPVSSATSRARGRQHDRGRAGREGRERVETAVVHEADEAAECRRLAELLNLDAVGIMRSGESPRAFARWGTPGSGPLPLHLDDVL